MIITRKRLTKIIKETLGREKMSGAGGQIRDPEQIAEIASIAWEVLQRDFFKQNPDAFTGRSSKQEWDNQVESASMTLAYEIQGVLEDLEHRLHNGEFSDR